MTSPDMTKGTGVNAEQPAAASSDTFPMTPTEYGGDRGLFAGREINAPDQLTIDGTTGHESEMLGAMYRAAAGHEPDVTIESLSKRIK